MLEGIPLEGIAMDAPDRPRFAVDRMLEKLGSYLRCLGFDAAFEAGCSTATLIERADGEGRVFLTRNRHLAHHRPLPDRSLVLRSDHPVEQLGEVRAAFGLGEERLFSRCIRCNQPLDEARREEVRSRVSEVVFRRYETFFRCPSCGTVFWKGSHVQNTCRKLGLADASELAGADRPEKGSNGPGGSASDG